MSRLVSFLKTKRDLINTLFPFVIGIYFLSTFLANMSFMPSLGFFSLNRIILLPVILYIIAAFIANEVAVNKTLLLSIYLLLLSIAIGLLFNIKTNIPYKYYDRMGNLIEAVKTFNVSDSITYFINEFVDLFFIFAFFNVFPFACKKDELSLLPFYFLIACCLFAIAFSLITEWNTYVEYFKSGFKDVLDIQKIKGGFKNKNYFGHFLLSGALVTTLLAVMKKRWWMLLFLLPILPIIFLCSCKAAILSVAIFLICLCFFFVKDFKKHIVRSVIIISAIVLLIVGLILFTAIPALHENGIWRTIYLTFFHGDKDDRSYLLELYFNQVEIPQLFFGYSYTGSMVVRAWTASYYRNEVSYGTLHNGIFEYLTSYGFIGLFIYIAIIVIMYKKLIALVKENRALGITSISAFTSALVATFFEATQLFVARSLFTFLLSLFFVAYLPIEIKKPEKQKLFEKGDFAPVKKLLPSLSIITAAILVISLLIYPSGSFLREKNIAAGVALLVIPFLLLFALNFYLTRVAEKMETMKVRVLMSVTAAIILIVGLLASAIYLIIKATCPGSIVLSSGDLSITLLIFGLFGAAMIFLRFAKNKIIY